MKEFVVQRTDVIAFYDISSIYFFKNLTYYFFLFFFRQEEINHYLFYKFLKRF